MSQLKKQLLTATNNKDKVKEIIELLKDLNIDVITLNDLNLNVDVEEDKDTLEGNALKKAEEIWQHVQIPCSADDTGLFVHALNGAPGVFSSRYAGENVSYSDNRRKLLNELDGVPLESRTAYFRTVVCYYYAKNKYELFDGVCAGKITLTERGDKGFGYDAVFLPDGFENTFAELNREEKNRISHRAKAFEKLKAYLSKH